MAKKKNKGLTLMNKNSERSARGLTLIEIIIVVVIVAILILIFIAYFRSQIFRANDAKRKADLSRIKVAIEEYEKDFNCYPEPQLVTCEPGNGLAPYIEKIPCDPESNASYYYDYDSSACPRWYRIYAVISETDTSAMDECGSYNYYTGSENSPGCGLLDQGNYYGCKSSVCVPIYWDQNRPGPECDPNFQVPDCYGACSPSTECKPWVQ